MSDSSLLPLHTLQQAWDEFRAKQNCDPEQPQMTPSEWSIAEFSFRAGYGYGRSAEQPKDAPRCACGFRVITSCEDDGSDGHGVAWCFPKQSEDATHKLRLRLGDVKNFALALLRGHEGDSIATDIANALLRLVGSSTQQSEDSPEHRELVEKLENTRGNMFRTFAQVDSLFDECISALREKAPQQAKCPTQNEIAQIIISNLCLKRGEFAYADNAADAILEAFGA